MSMTENAANILVCNQALGLLGAKAIVLSGTTANHTYCTTFFDDSRDEILASHPWNYARKRGNAIQTTDPLFGYDNAFTKPSDCLRVWKIADDQAAEFRVEGSLILTDEGETPPDWADETAYIVGQMVSNDDVTYLCKVAHTSGDDDEEPGTGANTSSYWTSQTGDYKYLEVEYIYQVTDVSSYPPFLAWCVVLNLAIKLASPIQQVSTAQASTLQGMLWGGPKNYGYMSQARSQDAQESGGVAIKTNLFLDARR